MSLSVVAQLLLANSSVAQVTEHPLLTLWHQDGRDELDLTKQQAVDIKNLIKDSDIEHRELDAKWKGAFKDPAKAVEIKKDYDKISANNKKRVEGILVPEQLKRLRQLAFRKYMRQNGGGINALVESKKFSEALGITPNQRAKLLKKCEEVKIKLVKDIEKLMEEAEKETLKVLSVHQQEVFKDLVGPSMRPVLGLQKRISSGRKDTNPVK